MLKIIFVTFCYVILANFYAAMSILDFGYFEVTWIKNTKKYKVQEIHQYLSQFLFIVRDKIQLKLFSLVCVS